MNRRQKIIVSVTGIFLVLLLLVGLTYAYFLTRITGNTNDKSISVSTANLAIVYGNDDGSVIGEGEKIIPGTTFEPKTFTVTNQGNANTDYVVVIEEANVTYAETIEVDGETQTAGTKTTFESNDFTYTLTCESGCNSVQEPTAFPIEGGVLIGNRIAVNETQTYSFTLTYKETGENQSNDMNKKLEAKINIKDITTINPYSDKPNTLAYNIINNAVALTNEEKSLGYAELVGTPYTKVATEISETISSTGYEVPEEREIPVDAISQENYWTYGTGYTIDQSTGKFTLTGASTCKYNESNCISDMMLAGEDIYIVSTTVTGASSSSDIMKNTTDIFRIYKVIDAPESSSSRINITYRIITNQPESVISTTQDEYGTSYYYRGAVKNNYLEFNNMCWRIVRIEGDGSIKITLAAQKKCSEITYDDKESAYIGTGDYGYTEDYFGDYENSENRTSSMKYKFDKFLNGGSFESYDTSGSTITKIYMGFSEENLDIIKTRKICVADTENVYTSAGVLMTEAEKQAAIANYDNFYYKNFIRMNMNKVATLICNTTGNKTSEAKIYPLTADEVIFAGGSIEYENYSYYLRENASNNYWWTLSLTSYDGADYAFVVVNSVYLYENFVDNDDGGLRPAISLMADIQLVDGDGTKTNPYKITG